MGEKSKKVKRGVKKAGKKVEESRKKDEREIREEEKELQWVYHSQNRDILRTLY